MSLPLPYGSDIYMLEKYIKYNKKENNQNAVIRDEALLNSYRVLRLQSQMARNILNSIEVKSIEEFLDNMGKFFHASQDEISKLIDTKYQTILQQNGDNKILLEAKANIKEYYAILEINANILNYFSNHAHHIYQFNKYSKYGILDVALMVDDTAIAKKLNPFLYRYDASVMKIVLILVITLFFYFIRTQFYKLFQLLLSKVKLFDKYSPEIMSAIHKPINYLLLVTNIQIVLYVYNNFSSIQTINVLSNIIYALIFTIIIYRIVNTVATIRIEDIEQSKTNIKSEMVNIAIKIINGIIFIFGGLLILHFAEANLATVLSGLGIGGFAVALAARESLSNFFGTISILMSDIYSQGDWIEVGKDQGTVIEIGLRVTTLRTFDNAMISIPNGLIANKEVKNWNRRTLGRRIKFFVGIKYDSPIEKIRNAVEQIREMLQTHPDIATEKTDYSHNRSKSSKIVSLDDSFGVKRTLFVYLDEFGDSSINILIYCFTKKTVLGSWLETKEDIMYKIMEILKQNSLEFAFQ